MTVITFNKRSVIFDGHAGDPLVCHGISAVSQMVGNYFDEMNEGSVNVSNGYLRIDQKNDTDSELIKALEMFVKDLQEQYPDNVKVIDRR